jgi:hypothetical protein
MEEEEQKIAILKLFITYLKKYENTLGCQQMPCLIKYFEDISEEKERVLGNIREIKSSIQKN